MNKIVSTGNYTLIFEESEKDDIECVAFETGKHMRIEDIGEALGKSRVYVGRSLKKSISKIYRKLKLKKPLISPIEIVSSMAITFNINTINGYKQLLNLFSEDIRMEIENDARKRI